MTSGASSLPGGIAWGRINPETKGLLPYTLDVVDETLKKSPDLIPVSSVTGCRVLALPSTKLERDEEGRIFGQILILGGCLTALPSVPDAEFRDVGIGTQRRVADIVTEVPKDDFMVCVIRRPRSDTFDLWIEALESPCKVEKVRCGFLGHRTQYNASAWISCWSTTRLSEPDLARIVGSALSYRADGRPIHDMFACLHVERVFLARQAETGEAMSPEYRETLFAR